MGTINPAINPLYLPGGRAAEYTGVSRHIVPSLRGGRFLTCPTLVHAQPRGSCLADGRPARPAIIAGNLVRPASHTAGFHLTTSL